MRGVHSIRRKYLPSLFRFCDDPVLSVGVDALARIPGLGTSNGE